jgi:hypothetical protein
MKSSNIIQAKIFFLLVCTISLASANYQQKETILSSITGNSVNIEVGGNTNLKGSLIAAGSIDENGNFIDNAQLSLTTGTLTYSSLSNSMYQSSNSFGGGTNVGFGELSQKDTQGKQTTTTTSKVNSSNINFGTDIGYSSEKVLATIGQGNLVVKDKENSDDTDKLNRDIDSQFNKLYEGSVGTSVEATVDHRFFSESGRKDIAKDFFVTSNLIKSVADAILKESQTLGDASRNYKLTQAAEDAIKANKKLFEEYNEEGISIDRKNELDGLITNLIMTGAGYQPVTVLGMNNDIKDENGNIYHGYYDPDTNTIFLNNGYVLAADKSVYTLGHESGHAIADQQGKTYDTKKLSEENADVVAGYVSKGTNFALWYNGLDSLSTAPVVKINDITQAIDNNNLLFAGTDKSKGEGLAPFIVAIAAGTGTGTTTGTGATVAIAAGGVGAIVFGPELSGIFSEISDKLAESFYGSDVPFDPAADRKTVGSTDKLPPIQIFPGLSNDDLLNQPLPGISGSGYEQPYTTEFPSISQTPNDYINTFPSSNEAGKSNIEPFPAINERAPDIYYTDYTNKRKQKANTADIGDILRTPDLYPNDFVNIKNSRNYRNIYTKEIWSESYTEHSDEAGEWKIGLGKNVIPTTNYKITVGKDGKIIKVDK